MNVKVPVTVEQLTAMCLDNHPCLIRSRENGEILYQGGTKDIPAYLKKKEIYSMIANAEENGKYVEMTYFVL